MTQENKSKFFIVPAGWYGSCMHGRGRSLYGRVGVWNRCVCIGRVCDYSLQLDIGVYHHSGPMTHWFSAKNCVI